MEKKILKIGKYEEDSVEITLTDYKLPISLEKFEHIEKEDQNRKTRARRRFWRNYINRWNDEIPYIIGRTEEIEE